MIKFSMKKAVLIFGVCLSTSCFAFSTVHGTAHQKPGMSKQGGSFSDWSEAIKGQQKKLTKLQGPYRMQKPSVNPFGKQAKGNFFGDGKVTFPLKRKTQGKHKSRHAGTGHKHHSRCKHVPAPRVLVPEPATLGLIGLGLVGLGYSRRYNKGLMKA